MEYVRDGERLAELAERLRGEGLLAADSEAAGYHRYFDRICLLQLSTRSETWVVDALAVKELHGLGALLDNGETEVIFHDADYDLRLLDRDFDVHVSNLFDTKTAAQFLGEPAIGLASLLEKHVGVKLAKKFQRADWAKRPLPDDMLAYAAEDTRHLPELRDRLREALEAAGRLSWAEEEFRLIEHTRWDEPEDDTAYLRLKNTRDLKPRQLAALRALYTWRDRRARERDVAPFRVMHNDALVEIARRMPTAEAELQTVPSLPRTLAERHAGELLGAVRHAGELPEDALPKRPRGPRRPPPDPELDARVDRLKTARDQAAERLGLDRGFLMPRAQLEQVAREAPSTNEAMAALPGIRRWQVEALGEPLLEALAR